MSKSDIITNEEEIFDLARQIESPDVRSAYVAQACGSDSDLAKRINELLAIHLTSDELLDESPVSLGLTKDLGHSSIEREGESIGPYQLLQKLGEGGFGVVFMAEQTKPIRRKVALKIIKPGMESDDVIARFEAERQALAMMSHPNIASVFDGGRTPSGRPYFVMELVRGVSITDYCDKKHLSPVERLLLFTDVCSAVQHAHQKGIIHRDIKPSNVMVTLHDGNPVVKVIDFGVAKAISQQLTEKMYFTRYGQMIGTPQYMSPEQAEMSGLGIDTLSDVYSLGVLLYELLVGTTPISEADLHEAGFKEIQRMICEEDLARPSRRLSTTGQQELSDIAAHRGVSPSKLTEVISGDLEWIVMKTLEKERERRYCTPLDLARDLERYLDDLPVEARPPSIRYRLGKYVRRHRGAASAMAAIALILVAATTVTTWMWRSAVRQSALVEKRNSELEAERRENEKLIHEKTSLVAQKDNLVAELQGQLYDEYIVSARKLLERSDRMQARAVLEKCPDHLKDWEFNHLHYIAHTNPSSVPGEQLAMFLEDGKILVSIANLGGTGNLIFWDTESLERVRTLVLSSNDFLTMAAMHPEGTQVAVGSKYGNLYLVDLQSGDVKRIADVSSGRIDGIGYHPSGDMVASASWDGTISVINTTTAELIDSKHLDDTKLRCAEFDPSGLRLATASFDSESNTGAVHILETETLSPVTRLELGGRSMKTVHFSDDGKWFAAGGFTGAAIWSTQDWEISREITSDDRKPSATVSCVRFSPDSNSLAVSAGSRVRFYDLTEDRFFATVSVPVQAAYWCEFMPGGESIAVYGDGQTHLRSIDQQDRVHSSNAVGFNHADFLCAEFSRSGQYIATAAEDRAITIWDTASRKPIQRFDRHTSMTLDLVWDVKDRLIGRQADGTLCGYDIEQGLLWRSSTPPYPREPYSQHTLAAHPTKPEFYVGIDIQGVVAFDSRDGKCRGAIVESPSRISAVAVSPDGRWLSWCEDQPSAQLWSLVEGKRGPSIPMNNGRLREVVFSPDSRKLAAISAKHVTEVELDSMKQWDDDHFVQLWGIAYSKSGNRLFISPGTKDSHVKVYDTNRKTIVDTVYSRYCWDIAFSQASDTLAYYGVNGTLNFFATQDVESDQARDPLAKIVGQSWEETPYENYAKSRSMLFQRDNDKNDGLTLQLAKSAYDAVPDCTEYRLMYGVGLFRAGQSQESLEILENIESSPWQRVNWGDPDRESLLAYAKAVRAMVHLSLGDKQQAVNEIEAISKIIEKRGAPQFVIDVTDEARQMVATEFPLGR